MYPTLFSLGCLHVRTYGACMALGFLVAWRIICWLCSKSGRNGEIYTNLTMLMLVSGVVGARLAYVIEHWKLEFAAHPELIVRVDQGGLMFYGGLILSIIVFGVWCWVKHQNILESTDLLSVVLPLGHAFGRIGCFFFGCCYGKRSDCALAVHFPHGSPAWFEQVNAGVLSASSPCSWPVLPTQLFEAAILLFLFLGLILLYHKVWQVRKGLVTGCYLVFYACIRFILEYLRGDPRAVVLGMSIGQLISLGIIIAGTAFIVVAFRRGKL